MLKVCLRHKLDFATAFVQSFLYFRCTVNYFHYTVITRQNKGLLSRTTQISQFLKASGIGICHKHSNGNC